MADISVSYSSADRASARRLAQLLENHGWSVWWDRQIPAGRRFDVFIAQQLRSARAAVVLWSQKAVNSAWVKEEAADARDRELLVPARLDAVDLPLGFRSLQTADLTEWRGEADHGEVRRLIADIEALIGPPQSTAPAQMAPVTDKASEVNSSAIAFPDPRIGTEGDLPSSPDVTDATTQVEQEVREPGYALSPFVSHSPPVPPWGWLIRSTSIRLTSRHRTTLQRFLARLHCGKTMVRANSQQGRRL